LNGQVQRPYMDKIYLRSSSLSTILSPTTGRRQRRSKCPSVYRNSTACDDAEARHDPLIAYGKPTAGDSARERRDPRIKSMPTAHPGLSATSLREALEARIGTRPTLLTEALEAELATRRQFFICGLCERGIFSRPLTFLHVAACLFKHKSRKSRLSVSTNGSNRPNSQTLHRLAVWTVGALVAVIRSRTRV